MLYEAIIPAIQERPRDFDSIREIIITSPIELFSSLLELKKKNKTLSGYQILDLLYENVNEKSKNLLKSYKEDLKRKKEDKGKTRTLIPYLLSFFNDHLRIFNEKPNLTIDDILNLIYQRTSENGKKLLNMVKRRNYYKRIYTIHPRKTKENLKGKFYIDFEGYVLNKKSKFQSKLAKNLKKKFIESLTEVRVKDKSATLYEANTNEVVKALDEPLSIICDIPIIDEKDDEIRLIPEPNKFRQNYETRNKIGEKISDVYHDIYNQLMVKTCKGRIFCHPKIRDVLLRVLTPNLIKECISSTYEDMKI